MVYRIRNKGFNNFAATVNPRVFTARKTKTTIEVGRHVTLQVHITRYSGMRYFHNYRRISRAWKQFLMGDKLNEQIAILTLRDHFKRPFEYESPIENNWYMGRTLADNWDRHYSLFAQNQHPLQLESYQTYNTYIKRLNDDAYADRCVEIIDKVKAIKRQREQALDQDEGETLSVDDIADIYVEVMAEYRQANNIGGKKKNERGEYQDYLEVRRPFGVAQ